jgi:hypothetical protein
MRRLHFFSGRPRKERLPQGWDYRGCFLLLAQKYGGLMPSELRRLKQLDEENGKLKRIVADLSLDKAMLQDVLRRKL